MADGLLTDDDMCKFLNQAFRLQFKKEQLIKPTAEVVMTIFQRFLDEFGVDNYHMPDLNAVGGIEEITRFEDFMRAWNVCKAMQLIGLDVGIKDVLQPIRKRMQRFVSQLVSIYFSFHKAKESWSRVEEKLESKLSDKERLMAEIEQLKSDVNEKFMFVEENRDKYKHLEEKLATISEEYMNKQLKGEKMNEESRALKQTLAQRKEKISNLAVKLGETKEDINELEQRVVRSPDKIIAETKKKEQELDKKRTEKYRQEKDYMEIVKILDVTREAIKEMKPSMESLRGTFADIDSMREHCGSVETIKEQLKAKESKHKQMEVVSSQSDANLGTLKEQISRNQNQHQHRMKPIMELNEGIKRQIDEKKATTTKSDDVEKLLEEERKLQKDIDKMRIGRTTFKENLKAATLRAESSASNIRAVNQP